MLLCLTIMSHSPDRIGFIASIWAWAWIGLVCILGPLLFALVFVLTRPFDRNRIIVGRMWRWSAIFACAGNPLWRFRVHGRVRRGQPGPMVVISNHQSQCDPFLISHLPWEMKWLSKESIFRIPFVGWSMRLAGDIPVRRGDKDSARQAMSRCGVYLERGAPVMIFPEGTRSRTDELLPFKDGAFRLAIEHQVPILPLAIAGTATALPKHAWRFGRARALVTVGEAVPTAGMTLADLDALKARCRAQIVELLTVIRPLATPTVRPSDSTLTDG